MASRLCFRNSFTFVKLFFLFKFYARISYAFTILSSNHILCSKGSDPLDMDARNSGLLRDSSVAKRVCYSSRGSEISSRHPCPSGSLPSETSTSSDPMLFSGLCVPHPTPTYTNIHTHINRLFFFNGSRMKFYCLEGNG